MSSDIPKRLEEKIFKTIDLRFYYNQLKNLGFICEVYFNRPDSANSMSQEMMQELNQVYKELSKDNSCRALLIKGRGKNFCAGADLKWMKNSASLSFSENLKDAKILTELFDNLYQFPHPTIGVVHGAAYGGAVGILACCDIVIADSNSQFSLSEVRLGLGPAVIFPYLMRRMQAGALRRISLTAKTFNASEAQKWGLVDLVSTNDNNGLEALVWEELKSILACSPNAQRHVKKLHRIVMDHSSKQMDLCSQTIAELRVSDEAQAGIKAFFEKKTAPYSSGPHGEGWNYVP